MKDKNPVDGSFVRRAANVLRQDILSRPDGSFLGSESELVNRLGVSRPTFRQAAKLVEQEQLLVIRRGVGGGYYARQPSTQAVAHVASVYLLSRKATMEHAIRAARPLFSELARLAARRRDAAANAELASFLALSEGTKASETQIRAFLRSERDFLRIFASMGGNPVLELYATVLVDFAGSYIATNVYAENKTRITTYMEIRRNLIQAILAGDEEVAELMAHRRSDAIIGWLGRAPAAEGSSTPMPNSRKHANRHLIGIATESPALAMEESEPPTNGHSRPIVAKRPSMKSSESARSDLRARGRAPR
jgi:DNA-binding FadR family transcriptional regulator